MAINEQRSETDQRIVMQVERKPLHVRIVSIGAFLLITTTFLILIDMLTGVLAEYFASASASILDPIGFEAGAYSEPIALITLAMRGIGGALMVISMALFFLGRKIFAHRPGRILQKVLVATICFMIFFIVGIGLGIIITFGAFFWAPRFTVNWKDKQLTLYRAIVVALLGGYMLAETMLTGALIGVTLVPRVFTLSLTAFIPPAAAVIVLAGMAFVIPMYLLLPRIIEMVWNMRPNIEMFWREFLYHPMGIVGLVIISAIVLIALLAPFIAPYHWGEGSLALEDLLQPPSLEHILGTNHRGEDIFSRLLYGSQISLLVGFAASVVAVFLGTTVGLISGYYGGILDTILMRTTDVFLCLPTLPLMLIFLLLFGQGIQNVIVVIAILGWTGTARMVRSEALSLRERPLTEAAHALGASDGYILVKHIMPNTLPLILANMILGVVNAILSEAGIAFLGFVDIHGQPSWGILLHWAWKNAALLGNRWWWFIPPGVLILLTTLGFVFISHTADKVVNPRLRGRRG